MSIAWRATCSVYDDEELADIAGASVRSSFADDDVKDRILRDIESWLASG